MAENTNVDAAVATPEPAPKVKAKTEKIALVLVGAGSCTIEEITLKKGERVELETAQAERFFNTGLFTKA